ncbi:MAG: 2-C-methyl-D-erythritol 4-phosphate cytidylyltransferase [Treponema sp.]|nr:2-C-methyl-D-erythritol 4-phosphate cytidylyltransferase [Treponema sp.]
MKNRALILAGGIGSRTGENIPKQFIEVNKKPVVCYTIEKFLEISEIYEIFVVCLDSWIPKMKHYINCFKYQNVHICKGGITGLDSVYNGISAMNSYDGSDFVLIHDAARPFIDAESIRQNIQTAQKYGCAVCSVDCVETLVFSKDGLRSEKIVQRDCLKRIMTPQTFQLKILRELFSDHTKILASNSPSAFCLYADAGYPVYCSRGTERNVKITFPEDVEYFKNLFTVKI